MDKINILLYDSGDITGRLIIPGVILVSLLSCKDCFF